MIQGCVIFYMKVLGSVYIYYIGLVYE